MKQSIEEFLEGLKEVLSEPSVQRYGPVTAAFLGSLALMLGADFGARDVLPTLLPEPQLLAAEVLIWAGTLWVCLNAVANSTARAVDLPSSPEVEEAPHARGALLLASALLALPGLPGAYLLASGTYAAFGQGLFGVVFGLILGSCALASIGLAAWTAGDADPALPRAIRPGSRAASGEA